MKRIKARSKKAFTDYGKKKLFGEKIRNLKTREKKISQQLPDERKEDEHYREAEFTYERMKTAEIGAAKASIASFHKASHIKDIVIKSKYSPERVRTIKRIKTRTVRHLKEAGIIKYAAIGIAIFVVMACIFSATAGGILSSIDMSKGQDNVTSSYLYLGSLEAKKGKLTSGGVTIDAEPMMAYIISEYGIVHEFNEEQRQHFTKVYNSINAKGYRSDTDKFFNKFNEDVFSSAAKYSAYKKLIAEGIYTNFKTLGSPFVDRNWVGNITSSWGWRYHPKTGNLKIHKGLDIGMPMGTPVNAVCSGKVISAGWYGGYGKCIIITYENGDTTLTTLYAHLSSINVRKGMKVGEGAVIGKVGSTGDSTGPHLHIEIMAGGYSGDVSKLYYPRIYMKE